MYWSLGVPIQLEVVGAFQPCLVSHGPAHEASQPDGQKPHVHLDTFEVPSSSVHATCGVRNLIGFELVAILANEQGVHRHDFRLVMHL
jgi:hypothetical protein